MCSLFASVVLTFLFASVEGRTTIRKNDLSTMIVGGTAARQGQFPYQLQLLYRGKEHYCGASLVQVSGIQVAITAAHCVIDIQRGDFTIVAGELDLNKVSGPEQSRNIYWIVPHPDYQYLENDIAIIFLETPFELNDNVKLASLPNKFEEISAGTNVTVSGWGDLSYGGASPNILQYVEIPVVSNAQCHEAWLDIADSQLCTGDVNGIASPCHGDSGGPAVSGSMTLAGVVSYGKDCADTDTHPAVFTKVSHFVDWIETTVKAYKKFDLKN